MHKKTWLIALTVMITIIAAFTLFNTPPEPAEKKKITQYSINKSAPAYKEENTEVESKSAFEATDKPVQSEISEKNDNLSSASEFNNRCLNILNNADKNISLSNISENEQRKIAGIFDNCVYEIDMELALIERQTDHTPANTVCLNKVYEIRDYLLELGTSAQKFTDMPNYTDSDRVQIAALYSQVLNDIITNGNSAMEIRKTVCAKNS